MNQQQVNKTNNISNSQTEKSAKNKQEKHTIYAIDLLEQHIKDQQLQKNNKETWQSDRSGNKERW